VVRLFPFLHALVAGHYSPPLFAALFVATVLKSLEETLICLIVPDPYRPVRPSVFAYLIALRRHGRG